MTRVAALLACALAACAPGASGPAAPRPLDSALTVVTGATLWDGTGAPPVADAVLLIQDGRIVAAGARGSFAVPAGARPVDARGRFIIPGLVDAHVHFSQSGGIYTRPDALDLRAVRSYAEDLARTRAGLDDLLRSYLALGITAVVDVGGPMWTFEVRERARTTALAPHVAVSGPLLAPAALPQLDLGDPPVVQVLTPAAARAALGKILAHEPDLVKILFTDESPVGVAAFRPVVEAIIAEAHGQGVRVAAHAFHLETARLAVQLGVDILVHDVIDLPVDDDFVTLARAHHVVLTPTLVVDDGYQRTFAGQLRISARAERFAAPDVLASWRQLGRVAAQVIAARGAQAAELLAHPSPLPAENLRRLVAGGVTVAAGTDAGNIGTLHGLALFDELARMRAAGLTTEQVLLAATRDAARVFAREPDFGTLTPGRRADFLILRADPLVDLKALEQVEWVAKDGVLRRPYDILPPPAPPAPLRDR
jgi:imidazolonepropionase-like amidohydrolase